MKKTLASLALSLTVMGSASAGTIFAPTSASSTTDGSSDFSGDYDILNTIDQSGLENNYIDFVTDFDSFVATTKHSHISPVNDWRASNGTFTDTLTYGVGGVKVDAIAIWNEDEWGTDTVGITYGFGGSETFLGNFLLSDNPEDVDYLADVFRFGPIMVDYFKFDVTGSTGSAVTLGEVAFSAVPVPAAALMFAPAFLGFVGLRRKLKA